MNKKIIFLSLIISLFIIVFIPLSAYYISTYYINSQSPEKIEFIKNLLPNELKFLIKEKVCKYKYFIPEYRNERIFPQTQFLKLNYHEISINGLEARKSYFADEKKDGQKIVPFYIETFDDKNILIAINGTTIFYETSSLLESKNPSNFKIKNNLPRNISVDDSMIYNNQIFISFRNRNKACDSREIFAAEINFDFLNFKEFYSHGSIEECKVGPIYSGGRMAIYADNGNPSILISTQHPKDTEIIMLLIDIKTRKTRPITSGHRNPQGLLVNEKNIILSTEHGPRGGDEINKIIEGKNYGWPTSSYGEDYGANYSSSEKYKYKKNHSKYDFAEPIYAFVPSVALSQIIKVPESFSSKWQNNYLITSLRALSIYRIMFDENYSRIITMEKIRIGKRIRDIAYNKKYNLFLLALENATGSIGLISAN